MRFLQIMLSVIWLSFGWLCYSAVQWQKPMEPPWHAKQPIEQIFKDARKLGTSAEKLLDHDILQYKNRLAESDLDGAERADEHAILAQRYWIRAYLQKTYVRQVSYLQLSLNEMMYALVYYLGQQYTDDRYVNAKIAQYHYNVADLYHQLKEYEKAEPYYLEAMRRLPGNPHFFRRYFEMVEESGKPPKIDYDTYFHSQIKHRVKSSAADADLDSATP